MSPKNNVLSKIMLGVFGTIVIMFVLHLVIHFMRKKKCQHCSEYLIPGKKAPEKAPPVTWVGSAKASQTADEKTPFAVKAMEAFFQGKSMFPVEQKLELCDDCYKERRKRVFEHLGKDAVMTLVHNQNPRNQKKELDYDEDYLWTHAPNGVKNKAREW